MYLNIAQQPGRVDFIVGANQAVPTQRGWYEIGLFDEPSATVNMLLHDWIQRVGPIIRLAYGCIVLYPTDSPADARNLLGDVLTTVEFDPGRDRELAWQINRPRESKIVEGLEINRLTKWAAVQRVMVPISQNVPQSEQSQLIASAVRIEFDISTSASNKDVFGDDDMGPLLDELIGSVKEILAKGDIP